MKNRIWRSHVCCLVYENLNLELLDHERDFAGPANLLSLHFPPMHLSPPDGVPEDMHGFENVEAFVRVIPPRLLPSTNKFRAPLSQSAASFFSDGRKRARAMDAIEEDLAPFAVRTPENTDALWNARRLAKERARSAHIMGMSVPESEEHEERDFAQRLKEQKTKESPDLIRESPKTDQIGPLNNNGVKSFDLMPGVHENGELSSGQYSKAKELHSALHVVDGHHQSPEKVAAPFFEAQSVDFSESGRKLNPELTERLKSEVDRWMDSGMDVRLAKALAISKPRASRAADPNAKSKVSTRPPIPIVPVHDPPKRKRGRPSRVDSEQHTVAQLEYNAHQKLMAQSQGNPVTMAMLRYADLPESNVAKEAGLRAFVPEKTPLTSELFVETVEILVEDLNLSVEDHERVLEDLSAYFAADITSLSECLKQVLLRRKDEPFSPSNRIAMDDASGTSHNNSNGSRDEEPSLRSNDTLELRNNDTLENAATQSGQTDLNPSGSFSLSEGDEEAAVDDERGSGSKGLNKVGSVEPLTKSKPALVDKQPQIAAAVSFAPSVETAVADVVANGDTGFVSDLSSVGKVAVARKAAEITAPPTESRVTVAFGVVEKRNAPKTAPEMISFASGAFANVGRCFDSTRRDRFVPMDYSDPAQWETHALPAVPKSSDFGSLSQMLQSKQLPMRAPGEQCLASGNGLSVAFMREVLLLKSINYTHLQSLDSIRPGPMPELVFRPELRLSEALRAKIEFTPAAVKTVAFQLLCGLYHLHNIGLAHGTLCPENVLCCQGGKLKLADWFQSSDPLDGTLGARMFAAPELVFLDEASSSTKPSTSSDIWSVGAVLGSIFMKRPMFAGSSIDEQLHSTVYILGMPGISECRGAEWDKVRSKVAQSSTSSVSSVLSYLDSHWHEFLTRLLRYAAPSRSTAIRALSHSFFNEMEPRPLPSHLPNFVIGRSDAKMD